MRILHVNKFLYRRGGAEAHMDAVARLQAGAGHEVAFFGMDHPANPSLPFADCFPSYVEFDPLPRTPWGKARTFGRMLHSTSARSGMAEVLDGFRPHVVHLHNIYHQLSPSILRPVAERAIPAVMTLHDYKLACPTYRFLADGRVCEACLGGRFHNAARRRCKDGSLATSAAAAVESWIHATTGAYAPVRLFLCPSEFLAGKMRAANVFADRMRVLHNFVDTEHVAAKDRPGGTVVYVGRLSSEKAVDVLIRAIRLLGPEIQLDIAGEGPERAALEQLALRSAPGQVRFHGQLSRDQVLDLLRSAVTAVAPSRWYENQPMSVLEAFACGVPVVTTSIGGLPELVRPGHTGALVPVDDDAALADALAGLVHDPVTAFAMGRAARAEVEQRFSARRYLQKLDGYYAEAMAAA